LRAIGRFLHLGVALLGLLRAADPAFASNPTGPLAPNSTFAAWVEIERIHQAQGPAAALGASENALAAAPGSMNLAVQHARLWAAREGFPRAETRVERWATRGLAPSARAAARLELALGAGNRSETLHWRSVLDSVLAEESRPPIRTFDRLGWQLLEARAELGTPRGDPAAAQRFLHLARQVLRSPAFPPAQSGLLDWEVGLLEAVVQARREGADAARPGIEELLRRARDAGWRENALRARWFLARLHLAREEATAAQGQLRVAITLAVELEDRRMEAVLRNYLARALENQQRFAEARDELDRVVELLSDGGDSLTLAWCELQRGWTLLNLVEPAAADRSLRHARKLFTELDEAAGLFHTLNNLGMLEQSVERPDAAEDFYREALDLARARELGGLPDLARNNLAILYSRTGRLDQAAAVYRELLRIYRDRHDRSRELGVLNNLALLTEEMGRDQEARILYERCIAQASSHPGDFDDLPARINLGRILTRAGEFDAARERLEEVLRRAERNGNRSTAVDAREALAWNLERSGLTEPALRQWEEADRQRRRMGQAWQRIPGLLRRARLAFGSTGHRDEAFLLIAQAESLSVRFFDDLQRASCQTLRAELLLRMGSSRRAREEAERALRTVPAPERASSPRESSVARSLRYRALAALLGSLLRDAGADSLVASTDEEARGIGLNEAFARIQDYKSHRLLEYVQEEGRGIPVDAPDSLLDRERDLRRRIDGLLGALRAPRAGVEELDSLRVALSEAVSQHEVVRARILRRDPRLEAGGRGPTLTLPGARREFLAHNALVLDYLVPPGGVEDASEEVYLFVLSPGRSSLHRLPGSASALRRHVDLAVGLMGAPGTAPHDLDALRQVLRGLSAWLLGPVASLDPADGNWIVSTDGFLRNLPFAALADPSRPEDSTYLVESHPLSATAGLPLLLSCRRRVAPKRSPWQPRWDLVIWRGEYAAQATADSSRPDGAPHLWPLRNAERESDALRRRFAAVAMVDPPRDDDSSGLPGEQFLGRSRVLHFIAHGSFDDHLPWRSGLYLRQTAERTWRLEIADLVRLDFRSDLVTLSACENARESENAGFGLEGFTRALFAAGARSVLASRWTLVDAGAAEFMDRFYENLARGAGKAEALARTQVSILRQPRSSHPYHWAGYVLKGEGDDGIPLRMRRRVLSTWLLGAAAFLLLLAGVLFLLPTRRRGRGEAGGPH